jgi:hypothetical protein
MMSAVGGFEFEHGANQASAVQLQMATPQQLAVPQLRFSASDHLVEVVVASEGRVYLEVFVTTAPGHTQYLTARL